MIQLNKIDLSLEGRKGREEIKTGFLLNFVSMRKMLSEFFITFYEPREGVRYS